jgi:hypothetical protein
MSGEPKSHDAEKAVVKQHAPQPNIKAEQQSAPQLNPAVILQRMAASPPSPLDPASILTLQRTIGNQAVQRLLARRAQGSTIPARTLSRQSIQPKLTVGAAGDQYEQEADRVAAQVMRMPAPATIDHAQRQSKEEDEEEEEVQMKPLAASLSPVAQREEREDEEEEVQMKSLAASVKPIMRREDEEEELQAKPLADSITPVARGAEEDEEKGSWQMKPSTEQVEADGAFEAGSDFESRLAERRGAGSPLPQDTRSFMESRFGADFGDVRVHTDGKAMQLNREISAQAFTHGADIFFGNGKYSPDTDTGKQLLAHELTHVIQQRGSIQRVNGDDEDYEVETADAARHAWDRHTPPGIWAARTILTAHPTHVAIFRTRTAYNRALNEVPLRKSAWKAAGGGRYNAFANGVGYQGVLLGDRMVVHTFFPTDFRSKWTRDEVDNAGEAARDYDHFLDLLGFP